MILLFALLASVCSWAQISLKLESNHPAYLRYEPIRLRVTITNLSGNTLIFGGEKAHEKGSLIFHVSSISGRHVKPLDLNANPLSNLIMAPNETKMLYLRFNNLFNLQREDGYTVTAIVEHSRLPVRYKSNTLNFEIRDGIKEDECTMGLPSSNAHDMIQMINFVLLRFRDTEGSLYCLRAEDSKKVYGTFRVGPFIGGGQKPQMEVENGHTLHLLLQVAPRLYCYSTYSAANREVKKRQEIYYVANGGVPRLGRETGFLKVHNVRVARRGADYNKVDEPPFGDEE